MDRQKLRKIIRRPLSYVDVLYFFRYAYTVYLDLFRRPNIEPRVILIPCQRKARGGNSQSGNVRRGNELQLVYYGNSLHIRHMKGISTRDMKEI